MAQLDVILQKINKYITLSSEDRGPYAADFDYIRDTIIAKMQKLDPVFDKLYNGHCLGGSYADNLKISKPDEFDLVLRLKLRESQLVTLKNDPKLAGYCNINIKESMKKIKSEVQNRDIYDHFEKLITEDGDLIQEKIQSWIEGIMTKVIKELDNGKFVGNKKIYHLKYSKAGPAHTITVQEGNKTISIDFVPAFVFDKTKWIAPRNMPSNTPPTCQNWIAVPKPIKNGCSPNTSFITSYVDTERHLIAGKNSLKNTLKMIKKLRDRRKLHNLKSYFIKTIYLWENEVQPTAFWQNSTREVLLYMMDRLIDYLKNENLPFFWDKSQNMLGNLSKNQIANILKEMQSAYKILQTKMDKVYDLFLTAEEKQNLMESSQNERSYSLLDYVDSKDSTQPQNEICELMTSQKNCRLMKDLTGADKKVFEIKEILKKYENNSEKILSEIQKIINKKSDETDTLTSMLSYLGFGSSNYQKTLPNK